MLAEIFDYGRTELWIAFGVLIFLIILQRIWQRKNMNLPPGPWGLPILGYFPFLTRNTHLKFIQLAKQYGDVFSIHIGSKFVVILNDADSIREAFGKQEFLGRPPNLFIDLLHIESPFFSDNYPLWKEQRRFVVQAMKDLGLGKTKIEGHLQEEIQYFLNVLKESKGKPINLSTPLTPSMSNNICSLVFGERYDYEDPYRITLDQSLESFGKVLIQASVVLFFPWVAKIPYVFKTLQINKLVEIFEKILFLFEGKIKEHKETLDPNNIRDFIDSYLIEMKSRKEMDPDTTLSEKSLKGSVQNLFAAGSETVRTSISWCMYVMAAFPDVQKKVQQEIKEVIGQSRLPQFLDQKSMPYTGAVIREVLRWKTIVAINPARYTLADTEVAGYTVPKDTIVLANFWSVHHDPRYWKDPETFQPERFLDSDRMLLKSNYFMPFSLGKRACPGETFAMMEVFLYFVSILQIFQLSFPEGFKPSFEGELGVTYRIKPHEICFQPM